MVIAVYAHEALRQREQELGAQKEAWRELESIAKQALKTAKYPLWHHSCRSYLPEAEGFVCTEIGMDVLNLAKHMVMMFTKAFESYIVIYQGYTENCYAKAEEYKILQLVNL